MRTEDDKECKEEETKSCIYLCRYRQFVFISLIDIINMAVYNIYNSFANCRQSNKLSPLNGSFHLSRKTSASVSWPAANDRHDDFLNGWMHERRETLYGDN